MIGQQNMKYRLQTLKESGKLPHFLIITGDRGSGKKTLLKEMFPDIYYPEDLSVDSIRKIVEISYKYSNGIFALPDADNMSLAAKNALLKVVEECPNHNYYIMTLESPYNTLDTIRSRAIIMNMDTYTESEIVKYCNRNEMHTDEFSDIVRRLCTTPGEVDLLEGYGVIDFYSFVSLVMANISRVSNTNALKISDYISMKEGDGKYDMKLFFRAFMSLCMRNFNPEDGDIGDFRAVTYMNWIMSTSYYLRQLSINGVNKQMLFDSWIMKVRQETVWNSQN